MADPRGDPRRETRDRTRPRTHGGADDRWRAVRGDAALAGTVLVATVTAIVAGLGETGSGATGDPRGLGGQPLPAAVAYLCAAAFAALMFVRRRLPVLTLLVTAVGIVAYHAAGLPPIGLALPVAAALFSAAEAGRLVAAVGTATGLTAVSTVVRLAVGDDPRMLLGYELAVNTAVMAAAIALGDGVRARRAWRAELGRRACEAAREADREAARQVQEERLRIARELHDNLAHALTVVSLHADVAGEALRDDPEAAEAALFDIRAAARDSLRQLRGTVGVLRADEAGPERGGPEPGGPEPGGPERGGSVEGLAQLRRIVEPVAAGGLQVGVAVEGEPVPLPPGVDVAAYRIVQESLTNTVRHARARRADVVLAYRPDRLSIRVTDDGRGCGGAVATAGHGIAGMRERAALLGGTLRTGAGPAGGYQVEAVLPVATRSPAGGSA